MILEYSNANRLLMAEFPELKEIYCNNIDEYSDLPYAFYESEFVPFIMDQLRQNCLSNLNKVFSFIEKLFIEGDEMIVNLIGVAVVESLYFENDYNKYKNMIFNLCGEKTRKSFSECTS